MNLIELLEKAKNESPNKVYLLKGKDKRTFSRLHDDVKKLSTGLKNFGIKKGDKIAILLNNSSEFVTAYLAAVNIGAVAVPLNTFLALEEVSYILNDCAARLLVTSSDFAAIAKHLNINRVNSLQNIVATDALECPNRIRYKELLENEPALRGDINENDLAVIIYTSGTTGHPKGAMLSHRNLVSNVFASTTAIKVVKKDRFILFLPMFHVFTFTVCILLPLYCQCQVTLIKSIQPFSNIIKAIFIDRISIFVAIPQVYNVLSMKKIPGFFRFINPVRLCVSGAAPLAGEVLKRFEERLKVPLIEGYGLSEASPVVSVNPLDKARKAGSVGLPVPGVIVKIRNEAGSELPANAAGEITVRGPNVMLGYFNRENETKEVLKNGELFTGDIGKIDEDGYIFILDRKKDLILINGMNLYPREVEEILYTHPAVQDAVVVAKMDAMHGEVPIGVVLLKEDMSATEIDMKKFCKIHLANFKIPHRFEFWKEFPKTATGKILKREIRRMINEKK